MITLTWLGRHSDIDCAIEYVVNALRVTFVLLAPLSTIFVREPFIQKLRGHSIGNLIGALPNLSSPTRLEACAWLIPAVLRSALSSLINPFSRRLGSHFAIL